MTIAEIKTENTGQSNALMNRFKALLVPAGPLWAPLVAGWLVTIYVLTNFLLPGIFATEIYLYLYQPLLWLYLAGLSFVGWRYGLAERPAFSKQLGFLSLLFAFAQIAVSILAGLLTGFGRSPYARETLAMLGNVLYVGTMLVGMELARAYLVTSLSRKHPLVALLVVSFSSRLSTPLLASSGAWLACAVPSS